VFNPRRQAAFKPDTLRSVENSAKLPSSILYIQLHAIGTRPSEWPGRNTSNVQTTYLRYKVDQYLSMDYPSVTNWFSTFVKHYLGWL